MPRMNIRRDKTGGAVVLVEQGEKSRIVVAHVSYPANLGQAVVDNEQLIWATATGATDLHKSEKQANAPIGMKGYIHNYADNTIIAVSRLDTKSGTIELIGDPGEVKNGKHIW